MANPQLENGFTRISNELLEAAMQFRCSGAQKDLILAVIRYTDGFQRTEYQLGGGFLATCIRRNKRRTQTDIRVLIERNVFHVEGDYGFNRARTLKLNKDYETWVCAKQHTVSKSAHICMSSLAHPPVSETAHHIKKERKKKSPESDLAVEEGAAMVCDRYGCRIRPGKRQKGIDAISLLLSKGQDGPPLTCETLISSIDRFAGLMHKEERFRPMAHTFFSAKGEYREYLRPPAAVAQEPTVRLRELRREERSWE